jgi:hypothetical protein
MTAAAPKKSRTRKYNKSSTGLKRRKSPLAMNATNPQLRTLQVDVAEEFVDWLDDVACYEERSKSTVARSILWLGRRVYQQLTSEISPYAPACIDITDAEVVETAEAIKQDAKAGRAWRISHENHMPNDTGEQ